MVDKTPPTPRPVTAASRYEMLTAAREPFLMRAREIAELTIPSLMPPEGATGATTLYQPYQSVGADGVNNLAAKLLMVLFPPGQSFFRLSMDDLVVEELKAKSQGQPQLEGDARATFDEALGKAERAVTNAFEASGSRKVNFEALKHLIGAGNVLVNIGKDLQEKLYPLDRYCVKRDLSGNVLEILTKESLAKDALPPEMQTLLAEQDKAAEGEQKNEPNDKNVDVYTWVRRTKKGAWEVHQEVSGIIVPGSKGSYAKGKCPWLPLRWTMVASEDYGRGRCEEYLGDLRSLEALAKAIVTFAAVVAKILFLVNESGTTSKDEISHAESGDVLDGDAKDVTVLMVEKMADFNVAKAVHDETKQRLERAFLLASSVQRQAERVTAEEIRAMVGELEQSLGGTYSILAEEFQRPLVTVALHQMSMGGPGKKALFKLPEGTVRPQIITGLDGLGRSSDLQRLDVFLAGVAQQFSPEAMAEYVNVGGYMKRRGAALGIDLNGLIRTEEEVQASRQQSQMQQMTEKLGPAGIKAMSDQSLAAQEGASGPQQ